MKKHKFYVLFISAMAVVAVALSSVLTASVSAGSVQGPLLQEGGETRGYDPETGQLIFVAPLLGEEIPPLLGNAGELPPEDQAFAFLGKYGPAFGLRDPGSELMLQSVKKRRGEPTITRYQQVHQGVPVLGAELIVKVAENGALLAMLGKVDADLEVDVSPAVEAASAVEVAKLLVTKTYSLNEEQAAALTADEPALWIYDEKLFIKAVFGPQLVWQVEVTSQDELPIDEVVLVNAHYGKVSVHYSAIDTSWVLPKTPSGDRLRDPLVGAGGSPLWSVYTSHNSYYYPGSLVCYNSNPACSSDWEARDARDYALATYNFYWSRHGRDSIDGAGMEIVSNIHFGDPWYSYDWFFNAFWDGEQMVYGDWLAVDDVVAHELTHGVTQHTSNLLYLFQPGAINESLSDVWGEFVDLNNSADYFGGDTVNRWLIGEDILGASFAFRSMKNPPAFKHPDKMTSTYYYKGPLDNGGVHINSGVNNKAVYLMTDGGSFNGYSITGIGINKVAAIYYKVQTEYLFSGSDYLDLYYSLNGACTELVGSSVYGGGVISTSDCQQVDKALKAVQMNQKPATVNGPAVTACPVGYEYGQQLFTDDFETGLGQWTFSAQELDGWSITPGWTAETDLLNDGGFRLYTPGPEDIVYGYVWGGEERAALAAPLALPAGKQIYLTFDHMALFETWAQSFSGPFYYWDGGVIEYSTNGGLTWLEAKPLFNTGVNYNGVIYNTPDNPLRGRSAFVGSTLNGFVPMRYNLTTLAGKDVLLRFRAGYDYYTDWGWFIDNVDVHTCIQTPAVPGLTSPAVNALVIDYTPLLNWSDAKPDLEYYQVQVALDSAFTDPVLYDETTGSESQFEVPTDLDPNTKYFWRVKAFNYNDTTKGWSPVFSFRTAVEPPVLVEPANPTTLHNNRLTFDWGDVTGATGYTLQVSKNNTFTLLVLSVSRTGATNSSFATTADLPAGLPLYWRVRANAANGPSDWSETRLLITGLPPSVPGLVSPGDNALTVDYVPRLDWGNSTVPLGGVVVFDYYQVQVSVDNVFSEPTLVDVAVGTLATDSEYQIPADTLQPNTLYYWRARAYNTAGDYSNWSAVRRLRTAVLPPTLIAPVNDTNLVYNRPTFDWGDVTGATGYTIQVSKNETFTSLLWTVNKTGLTTSFHTPTADLPANTRLWWRVRANAANGPGGWSDPWVVNTATPPGVPTLVSPGDNSLAFTANPLALDWSNSVLPAGVEFGQYWLEVATDNFFTDIVVNEGLSPLANSIYTVPADTLLPNRTYYWRVQACSLYSHCSAWSAVRRVRTAVEAPVLVSPENPTAMHNNRPLFDWENVTGATGYTIQVSKNAGFTSLALTANVTGATNSKYIPGADLPANMALWWRVRANAVNGPGPWSEGWQITTTTNLPGAPGLVSPGDNALTFASHPLKLDWNNSTFPLGTDFKHYRVQVSVDSAFTEPTLVDETVGTLATDSEYTIPADVLQPNMLYYWRVQAYNTADDFSNWSAVRRLRTAVLPPVLVSPENPTQLYNNRPVFDWEDVTGATGYTLQVSRNSAFTSLALNVTRTGAANSFFATTADLPAGLTLYWRVRANAANGPSDWSAKWEFVTANPPSVPVLVTPGDNALTTTLIPILDWGNSTLPLGTEFDHYQVQVSVDNIFTGPTLVDAEVGVLVTDSQYLVPAATLQPNSLYYWRVRTYNTAGDYGNWSAVRKLRTAVLPPELVSPGNPTQLLSNRPTFDWGDVSGATGYTIQVSKNAGFTSLVWTVNKTGPTASSHAPTADLPANTHLWWRVRANAANGPSGWSEIWELNTANPPSVPGLVSPGDNALTTTLTPILDWNNSTLPLGQTFYGYKVEVSETALFSSVLFNAWTNDDLTNSSYTVLSGLLLPNRTYYWRVQACTQASHCSAWSVVRRVRTSVSTPETVSPVDGAAGGSLRPVFDWIDVSGATGYTIQVSRNSTFTSLVLTINTSVSTATPVFNLPAGTLYWRVRANAVNGPSNWSAAEEFYTP